MTKYGQICIVNIINSHKDKTKHEKPSVVSCLWQYYSCSCSYIFDSAAGTIFVAANSVEDCQPFWILRPFLESKLLFLAR